MGISAVTREADFYNSLKKYFLDNLETTEKLSIFFEELEEIPVDSSGAKLAKWVVITLGYRDLGAVSHQQVSLDLYTRNDKEGDALATLHDTVLKYIVDESSPRGLCVIPYYDTTSTWSNVGGIIPYLQPSLGRMQGVDSVNFRAINLLCKWGGK